MANHCTNMLEITGPAKEVERFRIAVSAQNSEVYKSVLAELEEAVTTAEERYQKDPSDTWATNNLKEKKEELRRWRDDREGDPLDFNGTVPMPEELKGSVSGSESAKPDWQKERSKELVKKYGADNWYDWHNNNWGTKWNAYDQGEVEEIDEGIRYRFDTAWCPPDAWIVTTSEQFPKLTFTNKWIEEDCHAGTFVVQNGEVCIATDMNHHQWKMEYDEDYRRQFKFITEGPYEEVKKELLSQTYEDEYHELEIEYVKRIKREDLPLLVEFDWVRGDSEDLFEKRMKENA